MKINVKVYARRFEMLCMAIIPLVLIATPVFWLFGDKLMDSTYGIDLKSFSLVKRLAIVVVELVSSLLVVYALSLCIQIARLFQKDEIFSPRTASLFAHVSKIAGWWGLYNIIIGVCINRLLVPNLPIQLTIAAFFSATMLYLFVFVFLSILAILVAKASSLQHDQDLTV